MVFVRCVRREVDLSERYVASWVVSKMSCVLDIVYWVSVAYFGVSAAECYGILQYRLPRALHAAGFFVLP